MSKTINIPTLVSQTITNGVTAFAPSEDVVFDALALKADASALSGYQPLDADLTSIASLTSTSAYLRRSAANTYVLDSYSTLTGNLTSAGIMAKTLTGGTFLGGFFSTLDTIIGAFEAIDSLEPQYLFNVGDMTGTGGTAMGAGQIIVGSPTGAPKLVSLTLDATGGTFGLSGNGVLTMPSAASSTRGLITYSEALAIPLTGLSISGGAVVSTDSIIAAFGKLQNQMNGVLGGAVYQGTWNASTNSPSLASGVGTNGHYYIVSVAGSTNLDGITDWKLGDWAIFAGTAWQKVDNTDSVISVNGNTGAVALTGTANRLTISGANEFDIAPTYVGQTSLTTLGTITTGTWNGTAIAPTYIASMTSAELRTILSDENGSGVALFNNATSPTFTTDITTPKIIGGTAVGSTLDLVGTSGVGTGSVYAINFKVGNNGSITAMAIDNNGIVSIGGTISSAKVNIERTTEQLRVAYNSTKYLALTVDSAGTAAYNGIDGHTFQRNGSFRMGIYSAGVSVGTSGFVAGATMEVRSTVEQLRISYNASSRLGITVSSAGVVTFDATGASAGFTFSDSITIADAQNLIFNTTTGTKIGTATTQKLSFWNKTPIVQPTTGITGATVSSPGAGTNIKTDDTFGGYTIQQIAAALINVGILA